MAKIEAVIICLLIVIMDAVAGVLGIEAEKVQNKGRHLRLFFIECNQPVHQAYRLGLAAAVLLALAHAIANALGGCPCICSRTTFDRSTANKQMAQATLIISWIVVVAGFALLIIGALANSKSRVSCGFNHHRFLSIGGILCFVHGLFCLVYYVSAEATIREERKSQTGTGSHGVLP